MSKCRRPPLIGGGCIRPGLKKRRITKNVINSLIHIGKAKIDNIGYYKFGTIRFVVDGCIFSCQFNIVRLYINPEDERIRNPVQEAKSSPADTTAKIQNPIPCPRRTSRRDHDRIERRPEPTIGLEQSDSFIENEDFLWHDGKQYKDRLQYVQQPPRACPPRHQIHAGRE